MSMSWSLEVAMKQETWKYTIAFGKLLVFANCHAVVFGDFKFVVAGATNHDARFSQFPEMNQFFVSNPWSSQKSMKFRRHDKVCMRLHQCDCQAHDDMVIPAGAALELEDLIGANRLPERLHCPPPQQFVGESEE